MPLPVGTLPQTTRGAQRRRPRRLATSKALEVRTQHEGGARRPRPRTLVSYSGRTRSNRDPALTQTSPVSSTAMPPAQVMAVLAMTVFVAGSIRTR